MVQGLGQKEAYLFFSYVDQLRARLTNIEDMKLGSRLILLIT